jgi:hypothetical protein
VVSILVLPFPAMDPKRQSVAEAGAHLLVRDALAERGTAARTLSIVEQAAPDPEGARHLAAIRTAIAQLESVVSPPPET